MIVFIVFKILCEFLKVQCCWLHWRPPILSPTDLVEGLNGVNLQPSNGQKLNRLKRNILIINRQMSEPKLAVKFLIETDRLKWGRVMLLINDRFHISQKYIFVLVNSLWISSKPASDRTDFRRLTLLVSVNTSGASFLFQKAARKVQIWEKLYLPTSFPGLFPFKFQREKPWKRGWKLTAKIVF